MNKINILIAGALMVGLASCDDKSDLGIMQTNPQLPAYSAEGLQVSPSSALTTGVNLNSNTAATIPVLTLDSPVANLPTGAYMAFDMELSPEADFSKVVTMTVTDGAVSAQEWEEACENWYGLDPSVQTMYVRFAAYVMEGTQQSRLGGFDTWYLSQPVQVTPVDADYDIEEEYYLVFGNNSLPFQHSETHPYVDPNFTLEVEVTEADVPMNWTIRSVSGRTYGVAASTAPDTLTGALEEGGQAAVINTPGSYTWSVNMLDLTYTISLKAAYEYLYTPGNSNGWSQEASQMLSTKDNETYTGFAYLDGTFKFTSQPNWDGVNFGYGGEEGTLTTENGDNNLSVETPGLYWCEVNVIKLTYKVTLINSVSMIGGFNDWGGDVEMTASDNYLVWRGGLTLADASEWKFRMNEGWDINLGADGDTEPVALTDGQTYEGLVNGGKNFSLAAGKYTITLDLSKLPYSCTVISE